MADARQIFISYSHQDRNWMELVRTHLKPLERLGRVVAWDDRQIAAGTRRRDEIQSALEKAHAGLMLVSPNFLASDFIHDQEFQPLLAKPNIFWIPVSDSSYHLTALEEIQAVHDPGRPLARLTAAKRDEALVEVVKKLEAVLDPR
jgi:internalin A